ncbi:MAG: choice-of-anchor P family protein [Jatrophihabitans sp.]|uniref:choice-of-anchor P family protein n=1 Tax=Jatrophihabitans sp. TaxID=1932789 RepID=UPI003F7FAD45
MKITLLAAAVTAAATVTGVLIAAPAGADTAHTFSGFGAGVRVLGPSGLVEVTAEPFSTLYTDQVPASSSNETAAADALGGLVHIGAMTTEEHSVAVTGGSQTIAKATAANVDLLNGLITLDAVTTTSTVTYTNGAVSGQSAKSTFVNLKIAGQAIPANPAQNSYFGAAGIAEVAANTYSSYTGSDGTVTVDGIGLYISLLKPVGSLDTGATIFLSAAEAALGPHVPQSNTGPTGYAYATRITTGAGSTLKVASGRTAFINMGTSGTDGTNVVHTTTGVVVNGVTNTGVLRTIANGVKGTTQSTATMTSQVTGINLLGGLVKASAITAVAKSVSTSSGTHSTSAKTTGVNVSVAGQPINLNVPAGTVLTIGKIAKVTIDKTAKSGAIVIVTGLDIVLTTAAYGLPVGAHIEIARAGAATRM